MLKLTNQDSQKFYDIMEDFLKKFEILDIEFSPLISISFQERRLNSEITFYLVLVYLNSNGIIIEINFSIGCVERLVRSLMEYELTFIMDFYLTIIYDDGMLRNGLVTNGSFRINFDSFEIEIDENGRTNEI